VIHDAPVSIQEVNLVTGSIKVNTGLPDRFFSIVRSGGLPDNAEMSRLRKKFDGLPPGGVRIDPQSVQEKLDRQLVEADRQSRELDATPGKYLAWNWSTVAQYTLVLGGISLLAGLGYWKWRTG
jgi:hypothetical protein